MKNDITKISNFNTFSRKFLNLKEYCKNKSLNIYDIFKMQQKLIKKNKEPNILLDFAFDLMSKLNTSEINYKDFSTAEFNGIICATLYNIPIKTIYNQHFKNNNLER